MLNVIKKKSFNIIAVLLVAAICVTALVWNPLKVHAVEVGGADVQGFNLLSSSGDNTTAITSGSFGMFFATTDNDDERFNASNMQWTANTNGKWESNTKLLWANSSAEATVHAYYPYSENATDKTAISWTVKADQSTDENVTASDIFRYSGTAKYTASNDGLSVGFTHAGSKLVVDLSTLGTEISTDATVKSVTLGGAKLDGKLNLTDGNWTVGTTTGNVTMKYDATAKTAECIIIPQEIAKLTVTVTMDDGAVYQFNAAAAITTASGYQYTMNVQIGQDVINMGTIGIMPWVSVEGEPILTN